MLDHFWEGVYKTSTSSERLSVVNDSITVLKRSLQNFNFSGESLAVACVALARQLKEKRSLQNFYFSLSLLDVGRHVRHVNPGMMRCLLVGS